MPHWIRDKMTGSRRKPNDWLSYLVTTKQKRGRYGFNSSAMSLILDRALKYVIPFVGCSENCTGTPAAKKTTIPM